MRQASILRPVSKETNSPLVVVEEEQSFPGIAPMDSIFIRADRKYVRLSFAEIVYVEALRNYIRIVTHTQQYLVLMKIGNMESLLPQGQFCRIHRSYIISLQHVKTFDTASVYVDGKELPVGKSYKKVLKQRFVIHG